MESKLAPATLGYFTTVQQERTGWTGGLLVLNGGGRPLEFQCTLPLRPTKAHEILFGNTLRQHLICDVIGPTLLKKCRTPISMLLCEQTESLRMNDADCTLGFVATPENDGKATIAREHAGHCVMRIRDEKVLVAMEQVEAAEQVAEQLGDFPDLIEPFERIREAIREAQSQIARAA
ncbi:hypothetical protein [Rhodopirellula halodulae]|uniref:hypothetical protein n=1 Tax=Rhodopirellula halodulae TaxID=2894198 RepID=UPI001E50E458|nr:hypothetical protein [Rhodopirellula sp. JC737]MCC9656104.1 hypothetical protein [Rhodopirellula sp. JC737]